MQKALIAGVISGKEIPGFFKEAKKEFMIDVPGNGIMMTVPLKSVTGGRTLAYMTNQREMNKEMPKTEFNYELIVIIANSGHIDDVMDVARTAGADGGTVIHAKGTGAKFSDRFFGVSLADEKEVIFIAETKTKKAAIMKAVAEQMGPATPAGAICFTLPVSEIAGLRMLED
jgi:nitrogen regulatory protein PII